MSKIAGIAATVSLATLLGGAGTLTYLNAEGNEKGLKEIYGPGNVSRSIIDISLTDQFKQQIQKSVCAATGKNLPSHAFIMLAPGQVNAEQKNPLVVQIGGITQENSSLMAVYPDPSVKYEKVITTKTPKFLTGYLPERLPTANVHPTRYIQKPVC